MTRTRAWGRALTVVASVLCAGASPAGAAVFTANPASLGAIPDGLNATCGSYTAAARNVTFTVSGLTNPVSDVRVGFTLSPAHTAVGDLQVQIISPGGVVTKTVFSQTGSMTAAGCGSTSNVAGPYIFADNAPAAPTWWGATGPVTMASGSYRAATPGGVAGGGAN